MKKLKKILQVIVFSLPILLLPICAIAMAPWPGCPGNGGATSVPEPSTLALLAAAGAGILILKRYRKK